MEREDQLKIEALRLAIGSCIQGSDQWAITSRAKEFFKFLNEPGEVKTNSDTPDLPF